MTSQLEKIQRSIADRLARKEIFRGVKVLTDRSSQVEEKIDEKLYPKLDLSILVKMPSPSTAVSSGASIDFTTVVCRVRVMENLLTNSSGLGCSYAAQEALKALNNWTPEGASSPLIPRGDYPWSQITGTTTTNAIELVLTTSATL